MYDPDDDDDVCDNCGGTGGEWTDSWSDGDRDDDHWHSCEVCGDDEPMSLNDDD